MAPKSEIKCIIPTTFWAGMICPFQEKHSLKKKKMHSILPPPTRFAQMRSGACLWTSKWAKKGNWPHANFSAVNVGLLWKKYELSCHTKIQNS